MYIAKCLIYDLKLDFEYVLFEEFIQICHSICKCNQTESNIKNSNFGGLNRFQDSFFKSQNQQLF